VSASNGHVAFDSIDDAARAYSEMRSEYAQLLERLTEVEKQQKATFEVCRDNGRALELLLLERGLSLPEKEGGDV
jgi:hypothetical protein